MHKTRPRGNTYTLWGGALSLYTGKVRSYLIKAGIPYREYYTVHPEYRERVLPVVRLGVAPILETPDGQTVQDTTDIIECTGRSLERPKQVQAGARIGPFRKNIRFEGNDVP